MVDEHGHDVVILRLPRTAIPLKVLAAFLRQYGYRLVAVPSRASPSGVVLDVRKLDA